MSIVVLSLYIFCVLGMAALAFFRPGVGLAAVIVMYALQQMGQTVSAFLANHSFICNTMIAIIVTIAVAGTFVRGERPLRDYPLNAKLTLLLFAYCLISVFWSLSPEMTIHWYKLAAPYLILVVMLCPLTLNNPQQVGFGLTSSLFFGAIILLGIVLTGDFQGRLLQLAGDEITQGNPLSIGSVGAYVAIIAALLNRPRGGMVWFILRWAIVGLGMIAIFKSGSRGQVIGTFFAGLIMLPVSRPVSSGRGLAGAVAGTLLIIVFTAVMISRSAETDARWNTNNALDDYESSRVTYSTTVLSKWLSMPQYWVIGYGNAASLDPSVLGSYPHMIPVEVLCEEGFIGLGLFATIMGLSLRSIKRSFGIVKDSPVLRGQLASLGGLLLVSFILCLKQGSMLGSPYLFGFAIMLGRFENMVKRDLPNPEPEYLPSVDLGSASSAY